MPSFFLKPFSMLSLALFGLVGCSPHSTEAGVDSVPQPTLYPLSSVKIVVSRHSGNGPTPVQTVQLEGTGDSSLKSGSTSQPFSTSDEDLIPVLNELYRIRFFELPSSFANEFSVFLEEDGTVVRSVQRMVDAASTTVCVTLGDYEKCVNYPRGGPSDLETLVQRIFRMASEATASRDAE